MKRIFAWILLAAMLVTLTACQQAPKGTAWQHIMKDDEVVTLEINFDKQTITAGDFPVYGAAVDSNGNVIGNTSPPEVDIYHFIFDNGDITITYPNGATYLENTSDYGAVVSWYGDYDTQRYIDGSVLAQHLIRAYEETEDQFSLTGGMLVGCLLLAAFGGLLAYEPEEMLCMRYQWRFKNVEPTRGAILETRIMGIFFIVLAVTFILLAIFL